MSVFADAPPLPEGLRYRLHSYVDYGVALYYVQVVRSVETPRLFRAPKPTEVVVDARRVEPRRYSSEGEAVLVAAREVAAAVNSHARMRAMLKESRS